MRYLTPHLSGARVLDLFAGTGAIGLEALSRGAASCDFVENGTSAVHSLKANVAKVRARERTRIFLKDALPYCAALRPSTYDIAFADPPYGSKKLDRVVSSWLAVPFATILVAEHEFGHDFGGTGHITHVLRADECVVSVLVQQPVSGPRMELVPVPERQVRPSSRRR
jgi:16S rRNA G966 N2-methylase RsmD